MILLFMPGFHGGGAERNMIILAQGLQERGHEVALCVAHATGPYRSQVPDDLEVIDLGAPRIARALHPLVRVLRARRPSAILSTLPHANVLAIWARGLARTDTRVVLREANMPSQVLQNAAGFKGRLVAPLVRAAYPRADAVIAVSGGVARDLGAFLNGAVGTIHTIPNPAVTDEMLTAASAPVTHRWFDAPHVRTAVTAGSLTPQKDHATLLEAVRLARKQADVRLIVLGHGPLSDDVRRRVATLGLNDAVDLLGFQPNPFAYMRRCDVFVLSSRYEGLPNVVIQALAAGAPIVSTDCESGPREILDEGRLGHLVPVGDAPALAQALCAPPPPTATRQARNARAQDFRPAPVVEAYERVILGHETTTPARGAFA